jgi:hypothetical protein
MPDRERRFAFPSGFTQQRYNSVMNANPIVTGLKKVTSI